MLIAAGTLPASDEFYRVATEAADQVIDRELATPFAQVELHVDEVRQEQHERAEKKGGNKLSRPGEMSRIDDGFVRFISHASPQWYP